MPVVSVQVRRRNPRPFGRSVSIRHFETQFIGLVILVQDEGVRRRIEDARIRGTAQRVGEPIQFDPRRKRDCVCRCVMGRQADVIIGSVKRQCRAVVERRGSGAGRPACRIQPALQGAIQATTRRIGGEAASSLVEFPVCDIVGGSAHPLIVSVGHLHIARIDAIVTLIRTDRGCRGDCVLDSSVLHLVIDAGHSDGLRSVPVGRRECDARWRNRALGRGT